MEQEDYNAVLQQLSNRQMIGRMREQYGFARQPEETDRYETLEVMGEAYEGLALGIHQNVQDWHDGKSPYYKRWSRRLYTSMVM